jgi:DNA polymerase-3 subunit delta'
VIAGGWLPWQAPQARRFAAARGTGRIAHAWLLSGPRGVGKRHFADTMACALLCESPQADGTACGRCRSCVLFAAGSHPDWFVLGPEPDKRDIAIDAIRELSERLALSAQLRRGKVACIDPADALNSNGINALLKTIEEPPPDSYLLLLSSRPQSLPATLRSRCQRLDFPMPPAALVRDWLARLQADVPATSREMALQLAYGAPLTAAALLAEGGIERDRAWREVLDDVGAGRVDPLAGANRIGREAAVAFCGWLVGELGQRLRERVLAAEPAAALDRLRQQSLETLRQLERNANAQLALESLLIGWRALSSPRLANA